MDEILKVAPNVRSQLFKDVPCNYGVRMGSQLSRAMQMLMGDRDTRRAVIVMGRPNDVVPCCVQTIQFLIRDGKLTTVVYMRSWDLGLGYAYDLHMFNRLGTYVSRTVGAAHGSTTVFAGSGHLYREEQV